jgi:chromosome segregation ATPase
LVSILDFFAVSTFFHKGEIFTIRKGAKNMSDDKTAGTTTLVKLKDKLVEEFENLSQVLRDEKDQFNEEITRRRKELDSEIKAKFTELATGKEELEEANRQLQKKREDYTKELEKKNQDLKQMMAELERDKNAYLKIKEEQGMILSKETINIRDLKIRSQEFQKENNKLAQQKIALENDLKNLNEVLRKENNELTLQKVALENDLKNLNEILKKEEDVHFQKMAVLKSDLEELENEIEQKVFFAPAQTKFDCTKKSRELIIKTILGDTYRGNINIGSKERLSDMFTKVKTPFIVMYDVIFKGEENTTILLNKQNIVSIEPLDKRTENHFCKDDEKRTKNT